VVECRQEDGSRLLIGLIYRSPNSSAENTQKLNELMKKITELGATHVMIMGDFNFPEIDWTRELSQAGPNHIATQFLKTVKDCYLLQHQLRPTRFREGERENTVDLFFTNRDDMVSDITTTCGLGKSDHFCLIVSLNCSCEQQPKMKRYNYSKTDYIVLKRKLVNTQWEEELKDMSVEETWQAIKNNLLEAINASTPMTSTSGTKRKSWITNGALASVRRKHKLFRRWQETRNGQDYLAYVKERNKARMQECTEAAGEENSIRSKE
jgi:hypothetical protein